MNQQVIQLRVKNKAVLWIEPQYKQVHNDHDKLCAEYRKLVDDVREIKGHLDSLVYNLTPSVGFDSNQVYSSSSSNSNLLPRNGNCGNKGTERISKPLKIHVTSVLDHTMSTPNVDWPVKPK
jgi:hypothetical protein